METVLDRLVEEAMNTISGPNKEVLMAFSGQISFLKFACKNCLIECNGYISRCPHPECWPETTLLQSDGHTVTLEGVSAIHADDYSMDADIVVLDVHRRELTRVPCIIGLPYDN